MSSFPRPIRKSASDLWKKARSHAQTIYPEPPADSVILHNVGLAVCNLVDSEEARVIGLSNTLRTIINLLEPEAQVEARSVVSEIISAEPWVIQ